MKKSTEKIIIVSIIVFFVLLVLVAVGYYFVHRNALTLMYNGIEYTSAKTMAVEVGTGRIAGENNLTLYNADLEDHFFIYTLDHEWLDVGVYDSTLRGSR